MFQVRIYLLMLSKYPRKSKGYFGYRLETIDKQGRVHEKTVYDEEEDITANQLALVAMYRAFEELKSPCEVEVFTDSLYLRGNFVSNMQNWALALLDEQQRRTGSQRRPVAEAGADYRAACSEIQYRVPVARPGTDDAGTDGEEGKTCGINLENWTAIKRSMSWRRTCSMRAIWIR